MLWFFIQSLASLLLAFALGVLIGYLIWRLHHKKVQRETSSSTSTFAASPLRVDGTAEKPSVANVRSGTPSGFVDGPVFSVAPNVSGPPTSLTSTEIGDFEQQIANLRRRLSESEAAIVAARAEGDRSARLVVERDAKAASLAAELQRVQGEVEKASADRVTLQGLVGTAETERASASSSSAEGESRLASLRVEHDKVLVSLKADHDAALALANSDSERRVSEIRIEREKAAQALQSSSQESDRKIAALEGRILESKRANDSLSADLRSRAERAEAELATVRTGLERAGAEQQQLVATATADVSSAAEAKLVALGKEHDAQIATAKADVERQRVAMQADHEKQVSVLRASFERELGELRSTNATLQASVSTSQTQVRSLEQRNQELDARVVQFSSKPTELDARRLVDPSASDDLERIEGIGPAFHKALRSDGIDTFRGVRDSDEPRLRAAIQKAGLNFAPSLPTWSRQAQYLADGDEAGFKAYSDYLIAGQDPSAWSGATSETAGLAPDVQSLASAGSAVLSSVSDDLERIEGIGPKIRASLQAVGIQTFSELSSAPETRLREALAKAGLNLAPSLPTWSQQARLLANGDEEGFQALVERLIAGREVK